MRETTVPEPEITALLQSDNPAEQEKGALSLHRRFSGPLMQYIQRRGGLAEADAADVLNKVLYRAVRNIHTIRDPAKLSGWLYRLAYSAAMDWHRREARRPVSIPLDDPSLRVLAASEAAGDEQAIEEHPGTGGRGAQVIACAMAQLSARDQQVLTAIANDLTNEELAMVLEVTPAHARVLRHRAVERLRRMVERIESSDQDQRLKGEHG